jgi:hypothetical protein
MNAFKWRLRELRCRFFGHDWLEWEGIEYRLAQFPYVRERRTRTCYRCLATDTTRGELKEYP